MLVPEFWKLVDLFASNAAGNARRAATSIDKHLRKLPSSEIADFIGHYVGAINEINTPALVEAAFVIGCGRSNDGYVDFRTWVLLQPKKYRDKMIAKPDFLGTYQRRTDPLKNWYCEYDPSSTYQEKTGERFAGVEIEVYPNEPSDSANETILKARYPKLWKRCQV